LARANTDLRRPPSHHRNHREEVTDMWNRSTDDVDQLVPLTTLVGEGFAGTVGELVDLLAERGLAVTVDSHGRLCAPVAVATSLREERAEQERLAAQEAAEAAERAAERAAKAAAEAVVEEAEMRHQREAQARRQERIRRLEEASGVTIMALEIALRRSLINAPGVGMSYDDRQRLEDAAFSLDELEAWVLEQYGVDNLGQVTA
jgi:Xaa-Pro aminopeptidase